MSSAPQFVGLTATGPWAVKHSEVTCAPKPDAPAGWEVQRGIIVPRGTKKVPRGFRRMPYKRGIKVGMRIVVDITVNAKLNMDLYRCLKLPDGWRRAPRQSWKNENNFPVRIYTYQPLSLSAEELTNIQAQIALMETA